MGHLVLLDNGIVEKNTDLVQQQRLHGVEARDEGVQRGEIRVCLFVCYVGDTTPIKQKPTAWH